MTFANQMRLDELTKLKADYDKSVMTEHILESEFHNSLTPEQKELYWKMIEGNELKQMCRSKYFEHRDRLEEELNRSNAKPTRKFDILKRK